MRAEQTEFDAGTVDDLRRAAWDAWMPAVGSDTPEGWSRSPVDATAIVAAMPGLWLADGMTLRAYQHRHRGDGSGVVWALPAAARYPDPADCPGEPPRPPGAADPMTAIEGDGSPLSYLAASILARELAEVGAVGHGVAWLAHTVLAADPWAAAEDVRFLGPVAGPTAPAGDWQWFAPWPEDWRPIVRVDGDRATVRLLTFAALGNQEITAHEDVYAGAYAPHSERRLIAVGPPGFVL